LKLRNAGGPIGEAFGSPESICIWCEANEKRNSWAQAGQLFLRQLFFRGGWLRPVPAFPKFGWSRDSSVESRFSSDLAAHQWFYSVRQKE